MTLYEKIKKIYPSLKDEDFCFLILLQNDGDEKGDYIKSWTHPTLTKPTQSALDALD